MSSKFTSRFSILGAFQYVTSCLNDLFSYLLTYFVQHQQLQLTKKRQCLTNAGEILGVINALNHR